MGNNYRISCVSYLNSLPFIHGLRNSGFLEKTGTGLELDIPSQCAEKMIRGGADAGILPVAMLPSLKKMKIISELCIGASGKVGSVMLFSPVPIEKIRSVHLDYQSRTSAKLVQILAREYWKIQPEWKRGEPGFEELREDNAGLLIIGDRALEREAAFPYAYDLSEEWKAFTGLPFVFALWMGKEDLPQAYLEAFNAALEMGVKCIPEITKDIAIPGIPQARVVSYLENNIRYRLDEAGKEAISLFLQKAEALGL